MPETDIEMQALLHTPPGSPLGSHQPSHPLTHPSIQSQLSTHSTHNTHTAHTRTNAPSSAYTTQPPVTTPATPAPRSWVSRFIPLRPAGGISATDGVFRNMSAKPSITPHPHSDSHSTLHISPETESSDVPPSYASASADSVPVYSEVQPAPDQPGQAQDVTLHDLPVGSALSFAWNLLISSSFQFIGFLLTYLLHTSHAAKNGSLAGLGVTLLQYGFYLHRRLPAGGAWQQPEWQAPPSAGQELSQDELQSVAEANQWIAYVLMTCGWLVFITSVLSYIRLYRYARSLVTPISNQADGAMEEGLLTRFRQRLSTQTRASNIFTGIGSSMMQFPGNLHNRIVRSYGRVPTAGHDGDGHGEHSDGEDSLGDVEMEGDGTSRPRS